jgi:Flp pilus assembly pilin Flp
MKLFNMIKKFRGDEDGAVTVDWVVLTAAIVGLGIIVMQTVGGGVTSVASGIATNLSSTHIGYQPASN